MDRDQIVMGALIAVLCLAGLWTSRWFVENTRKGQWLAGRLGETNALWVLRGLFALGAVFGILLATNVIRPVQW